MAFKAFPATCRLNNLMADEPELSDEPDMATTTALSSSSYIDPRTIRVVYMVSDCRRACGSAFNDLRWVCIGICTVKSRCSESAEWSFEVVHSAFGYQQTL